jgi:hypothetical protein
MSVESDSDDELDLPAHEQIARLESRLEQLADELERCRKIGTFSKVVMAGGAIWLGAGLFGFVYLGSATLGAIAAILGGIVLNGSNRSTMQQLQVSIDAAERERTELIGTIDLRTVEADGQRSNDTVRWLH